MQSDTHLIRILLGVSGGIAAYKAPSLVRDLRFRGAEVAVVLTKNARRFVTETALQAVSGSKPRSTLWDADAEAGMGHIELARWANAVLIAPATSNALARLAVGLADDMLTTTCLATTAPIFVAPAMNTKMWSTQPHGAMSNACRTMASQCLGPTLENRHVARSASGACWRRRRSPTPC